MQTVEYSIVIPVYNSASTLEELFLEIRETFAILDSSFEVIFVEDCGQDNSWSILKQLQQTYPQQVIAVALSRNFGQHNAILCGFNFIRGEYVITIDDDLQTPPSEIIKLIGRQQETEADVVYGYYDIKRQTKIRQLGSMWVRRILNYGVKTNNAGSSFRLITAHIANKIKAHQQHFIYIDELIQWYTDRITGISVKHQQRKIGESGYSLFKLSKLTFDLIINYTTVPLRLMVYCGIIFSLTSMGFAAFYLYKKIVYGAQLGFTSIIVAIFFTASIILFCLGVLGEYIRRLYASQNQKPQFSIKKVLDNTIEPDRVKKRHWQ